MDDKLLAYSEIDTFLTAYKPLTPYGIADKKSKNIYHSLKDLNGIYDCIELMLAFIETSPELADKIEFHERRIPELTASVTHGNRNSEIFNVKKFLINYREISLLLSFEIREQFQFEFRSMDLLNQLSMNDEPEETFYIGDHYSGELKLLRTEINRINIKLKKIKEKKILEIKEELQLDFRFHDFLVVKESSLPEVSQSCLYIEPYDNHSLLVKPVLGQYYLQIYNSRMGLIEQEKLLEERIKEQLKDRINEERLLLLHYETSLKKLDTSLAKARLAKSSQAVRPRFRGNGELVYKNVVFVPLKERITGENSVYSPLSVVFDTRNIVISGSNMGGKTILLKTIVFSQLLIQMGYFVPGDEIITTIFDSINIIGHTVNESLNGLSSFGEEIMSLIESSNDGKILYIIDEFSRSTNSEEGKAIFCGLLKWFSENEQIISLSTTHHEKLPQFHNLSYWEMKGLDYSKYQKYTHKDYNRDLSERILLINDFMDYQVIPRDGVNVKRDALRIADILGLNSRIITYAEEFIDKKE
jgi:DNA mismatch repair ATPase MutS